MDYLKAQMINNWIMIVLAVFTALVMPMSEGYGFDAGATCNEKTARRGRAQLLKSIPCDLSVQAYCNLPGSQYPWHAVRRFVNENQGMMKRMYGDVRHISVLRSEINNNDITLDDVEETAVRYSRAGWKRNKYMYQENSSKTKNPDLLSEAHYRRASSIRPSGRGVTARNRARATQRTSSTTPSTSVETSASGQSTLSSSTTQPSTAPTKTTIERRDRLKGKSERRGGEKITNGKSKRNPSSSEITTKENASDDDEDPYEEVIEAAIEEIFDQFGNENVNAAASKSAAFSNVSDADTLSPIETRQEPTDNIEIVGAPDLSNNALNKSDVAATISTTLRIYGYAKEEKTTMAAPPLNTTTTVESTTMVENRTESMHLKQQQNVSSSSSSSSSTTPKSTFDENLIHFEVDSSEIDPISAMVNEDDSASEESIITESVVDLDGNEKPSLSDKDIKPPDDNTIGQLYQDVAQKDEPVLINTKGVNACPVKEEVVAPFWANNTRGEVLALLNLYPFEQYVHWEKCTQEHKQMYCRDGCRCEQQYRLHRLLAYDPHNECRGIFSDWFRFPSCCICKCYNVPFEYRVTSRSPRSMSKNFNDDDELFNPNDGMDLDEDSNHEQDDWVERKKNYYNDDVGEIFSDEIEF